MKGHYMFLFTFPVRNKANFVYYRANLHLSYANDMLNFQTMQRCFDKKHDVNSDHSVSITEIIETYQNVIKYICFKERRKRLAS